MLRTNIDVSKGFVNGSIGIVLHVKHDSFGQIKAIKIQFPNEDHDLEPITTKFEILPKVFVFRKQFPITIAYGITIHKSQDLSLSSVLLDVGNTIFSCGQTYVALSRATSLDGLHMINFDPKNVRAQESAINEYNRLRKRFRPELTPLHCTKKAVRAVEPESGFFQNTYMTFKQQALPHLQTAIHIE
jgi:ATP-dependent DNA helicase PIF1